MRRRRSSAPSPSAATGLKITAGLSGGAVNILMALVLLAVLGWGPEPEGSLMIEAVLTGAVAGGTSHPLRRPRRDRRRALRRHQPRHRGLDALRRARRLRRRHRDRQPLDRRARRRCWPAPLLALVHAFMVLSRGANQIAIGPRRHLPRASASPPCSARTTSARASSPLETWRLPGLSELPFLGPILFDHDPLTYLSFLAVPLTWWVLCRTRPASCCGPPASGPRCCTIFGTSATQGALVACWSAGRWPGSAAPSCRPPSPSTGPRT